MNRRIKAAVKVTSRKITSRRKKSTGDPAENANYKSYLKQAEVCREQAHDAARMKRWKAAYGLFETAVALCQRALALAGDTCAEAKEALRRIQIEMATFAELARSMDKPLRAPAMVPVSENNMDAPPGAA